MFKTFAHGASLLGHRAKLPYASVEVMVDSSSCSASGSHLEYFVEDSPE
jgi:hypothetical protein